MLIAGNDSKWVNKHCSYAPTTNSPLVVEVGASNRENPAPNPLAVRMSLFSPNGHPLWCLLSSSLHSFPIGSASCQCKDGFRLLVCCLPFFLVLDASSLNQLTWKRRGVTILNRLGATLFCVRFGRKLSCKHWRGNACVSNHIRRATSGVIDKAFDLEGFHRRVARHAAHPTKHGPRDLWRGVK